MSVLSMPTQSDSGLDELDHLFSSLKIDGFRGIYQSGILVRPPLGAMPLEISHLFLKSPEGKMLSRVVKLLVKSKRLADKTPEDFFRRMNDSLKKGTCYGEAQAILLSRRPKITTDSKQKLFQEYVNSIFFQVHHELEFYQKDDLNLQIKRLCSDALQLSLQKAALSRKIVKQEKQKSRAEQMISSMKKTPNMRERIARKISRQKSHITILNTQMRAYEKKAQQLAQKGKQIRSKVSRICKKVHQLDVFQSCVDQEVQKKWAEKKLKVFQEITFARGQGTQEKYVLGLANKLNQIFCDKAVSDFFLTFIDDYDGDDYHTILVQPSHPRLYDANVGEVSYVTVSQIIEDLQIYCAKKSVKSIEVQFIGSD